MRQVLEGYVYLGNVASLGEEVMAAFAAVMGDAALKVVRGVVLMRPTAGLEERAKSTQLLQELVKWLPPDLFRTCLSRVRLLYIFVMSRVHAPLWAACWEEVLQELLKFLSLHLIRSASPLLGRIDLVIALCSIYRAATFLHLSRKIGALGL